MGETRGTPFSSFGDSFVYIMRNKEGEGKEKQRKKKLSRNSAIKSAERIARPSGRKKIKKKRENCRANVCEA